MVMPFGMNKWGGKKKKKKRTDLLDKERKHNKDGERLCEI